MSKDNIIEVDDRITINVNKEDKELFMSAGMLNELAKLVAQFEDMTVVYVDAGVQELCICSLLVERDIRGKAKEDINELSLMQFEMSTQDSKKVSKWVGDHIINFMLEGASNMKHSVLLQEKTFQNLAQSLSGLSDSIQSQPSAGDMMSLPVK